MNNRSLIPMNSVIDLEAVKRAVKDKNITLYRLEEFILSEFYDTNASSNKEILSEVCKQAEQIRADFLEKELTVSLKQIKSNYLNTSKISTEISTEKLFTKGIELKIGAVQIPLGVAGPVLIHGEYAKGKFYVPLATNEAALLAGLQRGFKAVNKAGGVTCIVKQDSMTRAPLLEVSSIQEAKQICEQINNNPVVLDLLKEIVKEKAKYSALKTIRAYQLSNKIWLRISFTTGEAMGMNSAVKYTQEIISFLLDDFPNMKLLSISGNMCTDKKPSHINILEGRGKSVEAEIIIPEHILQEVFGNNISMRKLEKLNHWKNYVGSSLAGTLTGFNSHAANTIAAIFAATGQDLGQLPESSSCFTHIEQCSGGLRVGVSLPSIEVGILGGGTEFGTARECLTLLQCKREDTTTLQSATFDNNNNNINNNVTYVFKLAEIIGASVLAHELNLLCTLTNNFELGESHLSLARGEQSQQKLLSNLSTIKSGDHYE